MSLECVQSDSSQCQDVHLGPVLAVYRIEECVARWLVVTCNTVVSGGGVLHIYTQASNQRLILCNLSDSRQDSSRS